MLIIPAFSIAPTMRTLSILLLVLAGAAGLFSIPNVILTASRAESQSLCAGVDGFSPAPILRRPPRSATRLSMREAFQEPCISAVDPNRRSVLFAAGAFLLGGGVGIAPPARAEVPGGQAVPCMDEFPARAERLQPSQSSISAATHDIENLISEDPLFGPTLVRLAWHSSGTYDRMSKTGGSGKGTIRFEEELRHGANAGLHMAIKRLEPVHAKHPGVSFADLCTLSGPSRYACSISHPIMVTRKWHLPFKCTLPSNEWLIFVC